MPKPRVFIGSSTEGLLVAEAVFANLSRETEPTLWTNQIFTPGSYPLESLSDAIRNHSFAVLVASPDDELAKRGLSGPSMRDNVMLEFGLFAGAFGRRRVFFICPDQPPLSIPTDLVGLAVATYDAARAARSDSDRAAAVQPACAQLRDAIRREWEMAAATEQKRQATIRASEETQAIQRLNTVATQLRDALLTLQRESVAALTDRSAFEKLKRRTSDEVIRSAAGFLKDAESVGVKKNLDALADATTAAILDLPFPEELALGREAAKKKAVDVGLGALDAFLKGGDPIGHVRNVAESETSGRLKALAQRYATWWDTHSPRLYAATSQMQDALFDSMVRLASTQFMPQNEV
jgi:hypothetical protein